MGTRAFALWGSVLSCTLALAAGCAVDSNSAENVGSSESPLANAFNDNDSLNADTVVQVDGTSCTGTLITPKVVVTASHCLRGTTQDGCFTVLRPGIGVGPTTPTSVTTMSANTRIGCVDVSTQGSMDVALVYLPPADSAQNSVIFARTAPTRPSFGKPNDSDFVGVAGWSVLNSANPFFRQVKIYSQLELDDQRDLMTPLEYTWQHSGNNLLLAQGDSGGPLFIARPDNSDLYAWRRDVIGIASSSNGNTMTWADLTTDVNRRGFRRTRWT